MGVLLTPNNPTVSARRKLIHELTPSARDKLPINKHFSQVYYPKTSMEQPLWISSYLHVGWEAPFCGRCENGNAVTMGQLSADDFPETFYRYDSTQTTFVMPELTENLLKPLGLMA